MTDHLIVIPGTGEVVALDGPLEAFVGAWEQLAELDADLRVRPSVRSPTRSRAASTTRAAARLTSTA
jgi:hypothetical protein